LAFASSGAAALADVAVTAAGLAGAGETADGAWDGRLAHAVKPRIAKLANCRNTICLPFEFTFKAGAIIANSERPAEKKAAEPEAQPLIGHSASDAA